MFYYKVTVSKPQRQFFGSNNNFLIRKRKHRNKYTRKNICMSSYSISVGHTPPLNHFQSKNGNRKSLEQNKKSLEQNKMPL